MKTVLTVLIFAACSILAYWLVKHPRKQFSPAEIAAQKKLEAELVSLQRGDVIVISDKNPRACVVQVITPDYLRMACRLGEVGEDQFITYLSQTPIRIIRRGDPSHATMLERFVAQY